MNIRNSFAILSYLFHMSANKLSYEKFMKQLQKNYERDTKELWKNYNVYKYLFVNKMAHTWIPNTKVSKNRLLLHDFLTTDYIGWPDSRDGPLTNFSD